MFIDRIGCGCGRAKSLSEGLSSKLRFLCRRADCHLIWKTSALICWPYRLSRQWRQGSGVNDACNDTSVNLITRNHFQQQGQRRVNPREHRNIPQTERSGDDRHDVSGRPTKPTRTLPTDDDLDTDALSRTLSLRSKTPTETDRRHRDTLSKPASGRDDRLHESCDARDGDASCTWPKWKSQSDSMVC